MLRAHLLRRLRESENDRWIRETHERWSRRIASFARFLETLPAAAVPASGAEAAAFARGALDSALGSLAEGVPLAERL